MPKRELPLDELQAEGLASLRRDWAGAQKHADEAKSRLDAAMSAFLSANSIDPKAATRCEMLSEPLRLAVDFTEPPPVVETPPVAEGGSA